MSEFEQDALRKAAQDAWLWGLPLIEMAQQRAARISEGVQPGEYQHQRKLIDARESFVTTPNNDTLYSQAWVDLNRGPVKLTMPASGPRYFSLALMDMYTNNFSILGTRTTGGDGGVFTLVGPADANAEPGTIRSPTPWVWVLARTLVESEADLAAANQIQDQLKIEGQQARSQDKSYADRHAHWDDYFASLQELLNENPPPATDTAILRRIKRIVQLGGTFDAKRFSPDEIKVIEAGVADAHRKPIEFRRGISTVNGWSTSSDDLGAFRQNYLQRAATALGGLAALPRSEAMYFSARGAGGSGFDSTKTWTLTFRKEDMPPVDSFWSLTLYRVTADGQSYFVDNEINRYAIGDRTPNLKRDHNGALTIWMSQVDPGGNASSNWLPSSVGENFVLALRAYIPLQSMLNKEYRLPELVAA